MGGGGPQLTPEDEVRVLFPDVDVTVRDPDTGEAVALTLREFRFLEGLEAQRSAKPLIAALGALAGAEADAGKIPEPVEIDALIGAHGALWLDLIARACGREAEWLARLGDEDARALSGAMWQANGEFFFAASSSTPRRGRGWRACTARSRHGCARRRRTRRPQANRRAHDLAADRALLPRRRGAPRRDHGRRDDRARERIAHGRRS